MLLRICLFINCLKSKFIYVQEYEIFTDRILRLSLTFLDNSMSLKMAINTKRNLAPERQRWNEDVN
uniref:Uncharacterized protein n=1 Tax=Wuchereria bancrofti TaxID=6293 RepID=A0AAF5Q285_WUCBA